MIAFGIFTCLFIDAALGYFSSSWYGYSNNIYRVIFSLTEQIVKCKENHFFAISTIVDQIYSESSKNAGLKGIR